MLSKFVNNIPKRSSSAFIITGAATASVAFASYHASTSNTNRILVRMESSDSKAKTTTSDEVAKAKAASTFGGPTIFEYVHGSFTLYLSSLRLI